MDMLKLQQEHRAGKGVLLLLLCGHLELLGVGDFIRQTPDPLVSPVNPQPRKLLQ